ncbi:MAG: dihydrodipicolinate reductase [Roseicyclus sp.]
MYRRTMRAAALAAGMLISGLTATAAASEQFSTVSSRDGFVALVQGRELQRFGIRLNVTPDGEIAGRAFGTPVTGRWDWEDGYFCRDLFYGERDLGFNCQLVQVNGDTMRFTADQGAGQFADLTLR